MTATNRDKPPRVTFSNCSSSVVLVRRVSRSMTRKATRRSISEAKTVTTTIPAIPISV